MSPTWAPLDNLFAGRPVELIAGQFVEVEPQGSLYARGGVQDYWIVNLIDRVLEVNREPTRDPTAPHGWRYWSTETFPAPAVVAPLELPSVRLIVSTLLP